MSTLEEKSKEFLSSIFKIKKLAHKNRKSKDFQPEIIRSMKIIYHDYNPPKGYKKNKNNPWGKGKVTKIIKTGKKYKF